MKRILLLCVLLPGCGLFKFTPAPPKDEPPPAINVVARAVANTVALSNMDGRFCSGVIVEGAVLTAAHCVSEPPFAVEDHDGKFYDVVVAAVDEAHDLAVLAIVGKKLKDTVPLSPSAPGLGEKVIWMGYPLGDAFILGVGWVGNPSTEGGDYFAVYGQFIPGNSGGPAFNEFGELVGIVSSTMTIASFPVPQFLPVGRAVHYDHVKALLDTL